jgi:hypothetical protein
MTVRRVCLISAAVSCLVLATAATVVIATAAPVQRHGQGIGKTLPAQPSTRRADAAAVGSVPDYVSRITQRIATAMGDASPTSSVEVYTTRAAAERLTSGAVVDTDGPVYLVELRGNFIDKSARIGCGAAFPTGTEVDFTIDPHSQTVLDLGISNNSPDISSLGSVSAVPLSYVVRASRLVDHVGNSVAARAFCVRIGFEHVSAACDCVI